MDAGKQADMDIVFKVNKRGNKKKITRAKWKAREQNKTILEVKTTLRSVTLPKHFTK